MKNTPLITVIIPFYNVEKYIERAINSVLKQTFSNIELILIDDGSTDNSTKLVKQLIQNKSNCHVFSSKNLGPGNARNIGIKNANGIFLSFLDADDALEKNAIELLHNSLDLNNAQLSIGMYSMFDNNKELLKETNWENDQILKSETVISLLIKENITPTVWGKMFITKLAKQIEFKNNYWKEDNIYLLEYLNLCDNVTIINENVITIFTRNDSLTRQTISLKMINDIDYSYHEQSKILKEKQTKLLFVNKLHSFISLLLIFRIDKNGISKSQEVSNLLKLKINTLVKDSKNIKLSFKQNILIFLLKSKSFYGLDNLILILKIVKYKKYKNLIKVKGNV